MRRFFVVAFLIAAPCLAQAYEEEVEVSTAPLGSSFYRHLAFQLNIDIKELVKFEKRGFGRAEIVTLVLISKTTGKPLKDYGKRRLKDKASLSDLAAEAKLDYDTLYKTVKVIKEGIESQGDSLLPPPVYETPPNSVEQKADKKTKKKKADGTTEEPLAPSPTPAAPDSSPPPASPPNDTGTTIAPPHTEP